MRFVPLAFLILSAAQAQDHWVATWAAAQQIYRAAPAGGRGAQAPAKAAPAPAPAAPATPPVGPARRFGIPAALPGVNHQTVRMIARVSMGGKSVRVRLSNAFGAPMVQVGAAHIAVRDQGSAIQAKSDRVLTFSGRPSASMYGGQVLISDPVALDIAPLSDVAVSLYFPGETGPPANHLFGLRPTYVSKEGDFAGAASISDVAATMESYYWLAGIDVLAPASAGTLVTFGDSITDGDQSTPDTIGMWPALLAARLQANKSMAHVAVVNAGISGNRVLGDNGSALARIYHDVLDQPGIKWMTILEGINDITGATRSPAAPSLKAEDLIAAYRQMIEAAHARGVKVFGCTLTPYGGSNVYNEAGEAIRSAVNQWIRTGGVFDGVIDFDAATRDAADPKRFSAKADSPDFLHPANPGYKMMADAVNLSLFKR